MQDNRQLYPACNKVISHLTAVSEELVDVPLYFSLHDVCKTVKCTPPKADVLRSALINAGEHIQHPPYSLYLSGHELSFVDELFVHKKSSGISHRILDVNFLMFTRKDQYMCG